MDKNMGHSRETKGQEEAYAVDKITRLLPALPGGTFIDKPPEVDRLTIQVFPGGRIAFNGSRIRIEDFFQVCREEGLYFQIDHITFCG